MAETTEQQEVLSWKGFRTLTAWMINKIQTIWASAQASFVQIITQSAFAANNAVNVGMSETARALNPTLSQPGNGQIYTTQPAWDFEEGQTLQLGSTATINGVVYPIPSLIYDKENSAHVVFPIWMWDAATEKFSFQPLANFVFRHNASYFGGDLDGFAWQDVATQGTLSGNIATVIVTDEPKVGTWVRFNDGIAYGYVQAKTASDQSWQLTIQLVGALSEVNKVELYKLNVA